MPAERATHVCFTEDNPLRASLRNQTTRASYLTRIVSYTTAVLTLPESGDVVVEVPIGAGPVRAPSRDAR